MIICILAGRGLSGQFSSPPVISKWFEDHEDKVPHLPWLSQLLDLNPIEHLWDLCAKNKFLPPSNRRELEDVLVEEGCHITAEQFQTLVDSISRHLGYTYWPNTLLNGIVLVVPFSVYYLYL